MKRITFTALWVILFNVVFSQDLIVTNDGDSINCKITSVKADNIYFTFKHKDEIRNTLLPLTGVKTHRFDYFPNAVVPKNTGGAYSNNLHFRIALNGGYSYQTAKISKSVPDDFKDYVSSLKSGFNIGGDFAYFLSEPVGLGLKYYLFKTSNSLDNIYREDNFGNKTYGRMSDDLTVSFVGPMLTYRFLTKNKKDQFIFNFSTGYMGYTNHKVIIDAFKMTGYTLGAAYDIGYDIELSKNLFLGFQVSYLSGFLARYSISDGKTTETVVLGKNEYEGLSRIDFSIGLRFQK